MREQGSLPAGAYVCLLAEEAKRLQNEARAAFDQGHYSRASALIGDAELLADDVHAIVVDIERHEIGGLATIAAYDVRALPRSAPPRQYPRLALPSRRVRLALGASIVMSLALAEF